MRASCKHTVRYVPKTSPSTQHTSPQHLDKVTLSFSYILLFFSNHFWNYLVSVHSVLVSEHSLQVSSWKSTACKELSVGKIGSRLDQGRWLKGILRNRVKSNWGGQGFLSQHRPHCAVSSPMYIQTDYVFLRPGTYYSLVTVTVLTVNINKLTIVK